MSAVALITPAELEAVVERVLRRVLAESPAGPAADLTTEQVAAELGCAEKTVRKYARARLLKGRRRGQEWRFPRTAVDAFKTGGTTSDLARSILEGKR